MAARMIMLARMPPSFAGDRQKKVWRLSIFLLSCCLKNNNLENGSYMFKEAHPTKFCYRLPSPWFPTYNAVRNIMRPLLTILCALLPVLQQKPVARQVCLINQQNRILSRCSEFEFRTIALVDPLSSKDVKLESWAGEKAAWILIILAFTPELPLFWTGLNWTQLSKLFSGGHFQWSIVYAKKKVLFTVEKRGQ